MEQETISILLIEDNPTDVILLREGLEEVKTFSIQFTVAERLEEGLELLREKSFEAILLDLGLPDSRGLDTFRKLHNQYTDVPIIVLSGLEDEQFAFEAVQAGAQDYMVKGRVGGESIARATRYAIERQRSKAALRASEDRFRSLFEHSPVAYQSLNSEGRFIDVNEQLCEMLGYERQELLGKSFGDLWTPESRSAFPGIFERFRQDGETSTEIKLIKKDGALIDVVADGRAQYDINGQMVKTHCILHDVTERVLAEQAIRESQERFGTVFRASPISIFITTTDEIILDANEAFLEMFGYERSQVLSRAMSELNLWHDPEDRNRLIRLLGQEGIISNHEIKYRTSSREVRDALVSVELIELAGKQCLLIMLNDITERIQVEAELHSTRKFLQGVQDSLSAHIAILDHEGVIRQVNQAWREFGTTNGYEHPDFGVGLNYLEICDSATGPNFEEAQLAAEAIRRVLAGEQDYARIEYPCHSPEEKRWFVLHVTSFEDQDGRWAVLSHENITERKEAENAVKRAEEHFKALIEHAPDGIVLIDAEGKFKYGSPSAKMMFGYSPDEKIDIHPDDATHPDDLQMVLTTLDDLIKNPSQTPTIQYRFRHKEGSWIWVESTFSNLLTEPSVGAIVINFREVTERKKSEAAVQESEARFSTVFHSSPLAIAITRLQDNQLIEVNKAWLDLTGYQREEVIGRTPLDLKLWVNVKDRENAVKKLDDHGKINHFEIQIRKKSGEYADLLFSAESINLAGKASMLSMALDISGRKKWEHDIRKHAEDLELINKINEAVNRGENLPEIIRIFSKEATHIIACDSATVYLVSEDKKYLEMQNLTIPQKTVKRIEKLIGMQLPRIRIPLKEGSTSYKLLQTDKPTLLNTPEDIQDWIGEFAEAIDLPKNLRKIVRGMAPKIYEIVGAQFVITVPLISEEKAIGLMDISGSNPLKEEDLSRIQHVASLITAAIQRKQADESVHQKQASLTALIENTDGSIWSIDKEYRLVLGNSVFHQNIEEWRGRPFTPGESILSENFPPDVSEDWRAYYDRVLEGEQFVVETKRRFINTTRTMEYRLNPILDSAGVVTGATIYGRDITERVQAEKHNKFQAELLNAVGQAVIATDPEGTISYMNKAAGELYRWDREEAIGLNIMEVSVPEISKEEAETIMAVLRNGQPWSGEFLVKRKDKTTFTAEVFDSPVMNDDGELTAIIGISSNITERNQTTRRIEQLKDFNESIVQSMSEGIVIEDKQGFFTFLNPAACSMLGYTSDELMGKHWKTIIPPDQQPIVHSANERRTRGENDRYELEMIRKDGRRIFLLVSGSPSFDAEGKFNGTIAVFSDISEQMQASEALRQSEERFRNLIDQIPAIVYIDDASTEPGQTQFVSPYLQKMLGFSPEEWISGGFEFWKERLHPDDRERVLADYQSAIKNVDGLNCEYRLFTKDGRVIWVRDQAITLNDENGKSKSVQGIIQDITERKLSNKALRESEQRFRMLFATSPDAILVIDPHDEKVVWPIVDCNEAACQMNGYTREELIGQSIDILNPTPETREEHNVYLEQMKSAGVIRLEAAHRHKDGHLFPIEVSSSVFTLEGREFVLGIDRDISQRRLIDAENKHRVAELETLYENGLLISGLLNPKKIAQRIVEVLEQNLNWHHVAIRQYDPSSDRLELLAFSQPDMNSAQLERHIKRLNQEISTPDYGLSGWVIRHGKPARSGNLSEEQNYVATFPGLKSGLYVPIQAGSVTIGSIAVESKVENAFTDQDERLLITLANQAAVSFENANLYTRLQKELGERRQAEDKVRRLNIELENRVVERTAEIRAAHQRLELATAAAGIGVWELNMQSDELVWDKGVHKIYGTTPEMFSDLNHTIWLNFVHPDDRQNVKNTWAQVLKQDSPYQDEYRIIRVDGSVRYISAYAITLFDEEHKYKSTIGVNMDITTIKQAEETLRMANMELERALKVKDEFLANMSHELRTPLNAILGLSESLEEQIAGPLNEKQQKYIHTIGESGHHLLALINDILDLAKIEAGQIILDITKVNISLVCQASVRMIKQLAQKKEQNVSVEIDEKVDLILADERRLKQMIVNLLSNAVKFTPQGGKLGIKVSANQSDNTVMITVWDNGIGIKDDDMERLFQPFVQLDASLDRESPGTGLGLALVAQMTRLHGGRIAVDSTLEKGSHFTITLPWKPAVHTGSLKRRTAELEDKHDSSTENKQTILLVEDTDAVVMMLKDYLESAGYHMIIARDGLEGITQAKRLSPDLILMDVMMPGMDGLEATRKIRNEPDLAHIPIIGLTALAMSSDRERCLAAGMDGYMSKPVMLNELVSTIENYLTPNEETE